MIFYTFYPRKNMHLCYFFYMQVLSRQYSDKERTASFDTVPLVLSAVYFDTVDCFR